MGEEEEMGRGEGGRGGLVALSLGVDVGVSVPRFEAGVTTRQPPPAEVAAKSTVCEPTSSTVPPLLGSPPLCADPVDLGRGWRLGSGLGATTTTTSATTTTTTTTTIITTTIITTTKGGESGGEWGGEGGAKVGKGGL